VTRRFFSSIKKKKNEIVESSSSIESSHRATTDLLDSYSQGPFLILYKR